MGQNRRSFSSEYAPGRAIWAKLVQTEVAPPWRRSVRARSRANNGLSADRRLLAAVPAPSLLESVLARWAHEPLSGVPDLPPDQARYSGLPGSRSGHRSHDSEHGSLPHESSLPQFRVHPWCGHSPRSPKHWRTAVSQAAAPRFVPCPPQP